ncbi:uncharacterized protein BDR25DRAFT_384004 [Lindgomyces ingoldianus]|uniref:Uncharacterized protein n=1 Tax=Lindgomyces ingoldianus TaxID=673940 RepID=A0ACB6R5T4_9PLEO|nr:uncharacterized protein BDR25DRAFT_384004 [Lindgomyces ingoldianus]KAF2474643.1 hypothetical protein BDR25DRAFT_384004 [Lindgomyces ingoldianus]
MAATGIPLHCNICPKRPNFSDVSHLLTHIASKGHLSHYYKVKVRSGSEDASRRLIEAYDRWYAEWNVEDLMSERMSQKDKRRTRTRTIVRANPAPKIEAPAPRSTRPRAAVSALLDPRLSEHHMVKIEASVTPTPPPPGPILRHRAFPPRMQYWPTGSRSTSHSYTNPDYETSSEYSDPSDRRRYQYHVDDSCAIDDDPADTATFSTEDTGGTSECTKLKGVYWPGMDLFDSATPEMRRKRNQKKDISVVEQLELNSQEVEPTELIFTPHGSFKKQRRISGSVYDDEESSPIKAESPRPYLTRPALADLDPNAARRTRQHFRPPVFPYASRNPYENDHGHSGYGYGDLHGQRRRRAFDVFQDDEVTFAQPASLNYLTAGFHHHHHHQQQPSPSPAPSFAPYKAYNDSYTGHENKENILPAYHPPTYDHHHHHQPSGYNYPAYAYGLGHDHYAFQSGHPIYMNNGYLQQHNEVADDQRTLTAPPSPSTA